MTAEQIESVARCCRELGTENAYLRREVAAQTARAEAADRALAAALRQIHEMQEGQHAQGA